MKLVLASDNSGKIRELTNYLSDTLFTVVPQSNFAISTPPETAETFLENALLKVRHACAKSGLPAVADDSGLVVPALKGAPGVYSARFAGEGASDEENLNKLIEQIKSLPDSARSAYYYCSLVMMKHEHDPTPIVCSGQWWGQLITTPRGKDGFGYDPMFYLPDQDCTAAELAIDEKNALSHRGLAMQELAASFLTMVE